MYFMQNNTEEVDTKAGWIRDIQRCTIDSEGVGIPLTRREAEEIFREAFTQVKKDKNGRWINVIRTRRF